uniref:General transcription factor IIIC, polypeptide 3 n=1 Tax=Scleropages formosus TaxID=113540 RepID=A0A8C9WQR5_SCLFO
MSGFSPELIDYLEGRISFEEFEQRREERRAKEKVVCTVTAGVVPLQHVCLFAHVCVCVCVSEGVSPSVQKAFASMLGEPARKARQDDEHPDEDVDDTEVLSAGDVFALEMKLNRENKKMMRERRHRSKLPRALRGLMGEANIRYARGDKEDAIMMCMEIIRQAPLAYEPFSTLAMIYEDQGDMEKSLQFGLIAAHLNPSDCDEWVKLADMSLEQDNIKQAIVCYSKAIKYDPSNVRYLWERSSLYEQVGDHKQAMDGYRRILNLLPSSDGEQFMQLSRDMAKSYYETSDLQAAIGVMEEAMNRHPGLVTHECVNMAAELYIASHEHKKALQALLHFCGIVLERSSSKQTVEGQQEDRNQTDEEKKNEEEVFFNKVFLFPVGEVQWVHIPHEVPIDLRVKLMVCLIQQHIFKPLDPMLTALMEQSPEEFGDLYLDVAEAFLDEGKYSSALPLLSALVCSERYNLAVVWLRHADCLKALGHMEVAVKSYTKVVEMAPLHLEARLSSSTLQQQLGNPSGALKALEPMHDSETLAKDSAATQQELKLLLHRSILLRSQGRVDDYLDAILTMLAMLLKVAMNRAQVCLVSKSTSGEKHLYLIKVCREKISDIEDQEAAYLDVIGTKSTSVLSRDDWWQLLLRCICVLSEQQRFGEAELLVDSSLEYYSFYDDREKRKELEYFGLSAAILDRNFRKAYNYIRLMLMDSVDRPQLWNIFNQVTMHSQDVRHHRFCLRLMLKNPENHALCVLNGHNAFVSGSFKHALGRYMLCPLVCVALVFLTDQFNGFSFLWRYLELRGHCQESLYNMGRAMQQLGLAHLAIHYYQKALVSPVPASEVPASFYTGSLTVW